MTGGAVAATSIAMPRIARAQAALMSLRCGTATPGFTVVFFDYVRDNMLDEKYGFKLAAPMLATSISTLLSEFVAGSLDITTSVFDNWAERHLAGVPVKLICGLTTADQIAIVVPGDGAKTLADLRGKTIAAPVASGIYRMTRALVREVAGVDLESEANIQNAENPAQGVTLVLANRADAAVAWEPMISSAMIKKPDLRIVADTGELYREKFKLDLPMFTLGARRELLERGSDVGKRLLAMYSDCMQGIEQNFAAVAERYAGRMLIEAKVSQMAKTAGRLRFNYVSCAEEPGRHLFREGFELLVRNKALSRMPDDSIFVDA
ncbi:MAG: PhnD/SsuA/transferrin family substrate-binding protein [Xanthobacteraceae bacterium]